MIQLINPKQIRGTMKKSDIKEQDFWTILSFYYVKASSVNLEEECRKLQWMLPTNSYILVSSSYVLDMDGIT